MFIIKYKWIFLTISFLLIVVSLFLIITKGIKRGIDFTGGTQISIEYLGEQKDNVDAKVLKENFNLNGFSVRNVSLYKDIKKGSVIATINVKDKIQDSEKKSFDAIWSYDGDVKFSASQISENIIGPSIGKELTKKAILSIIFVSIIIILFVAYSFRHISKPVSSLKYGVITIITLIHDVVIPAGVFAVLSERSGAEIDSLFILALLTIIGLSISDTIVIFDRIRENLNKKISGESFPVVVGKSLSQTLLRSFNTSFALIIVIVCLYIFGPKSLYNFNLVLLIGVIVGTYSSIFIASPVLVLVEKYQKKNK